MVANSGELFRDNLYLVYSKALKFRPNSLSDFDDFIQVGSIGLLQAVREYDPAICPVFEAYALVCIKNAILHETRKQRGYNQEYVYERGYTPNSTDWLPSNLEPHEYDFLKMKLAGCTLKEIADHFGYTKSWAKQELVKIIRKIQQANG